MDGRVDRHQTDSCGFFPLFITTKRQAASSTFLRSLSSLFMRTGGRPNRMYPNTCSFTFSSSHCSHIRHGVATATFLHLTHSRSPNASSSDSEGNYAIFKGVFFAGVARPPLSPPRHILHDEGRGASKLGPWQVSLVHVSHDVSQLIRLQRLFLVRQGVPPRLRQRLKA